MAYQITAITPNGDTLRNVTEGAPKVQALIKDALGGAWLELVPGFDQYGDAPCVVFCDEEGKLKGLPTNGKATYLWYACLAPKPFRPDVLHGTVVIVTADDPMELSKL